MRTRFLLLTGALLLAGCTDRPLLVAPEQDEAAVQVGPPGGSEMVRVIVRLSSRGDQGQVRAAAQAQGGRVIHEYRRLPFLNLEVPAAAIQGLRNSPRVLSIMEDIPEFPSLNNSLPVIGGDVVHGLGWDGSGTVVVILDTGLDRNHPFFAGRVVAEACFSSDGAGQTSLCPDGTTEQTGAGAANIEITPCDDGGSNICDHGPHVAGIAAGDGDAADAPGPGVAPGARVIGIQVFTRFNNDADCGGAPGDAPCVASFPGDQIRAIEHVLDNLLPVHNVVAVNMSLGGGQNTTACDDDQRKEWIDDLRDENVATIIAATNAGFLNAISRPACISTSIAVGATDNNDNIAGFSNRGPLLHLFAPGVGNVSAISRFQGTGYGSKNGTSMAAPHVAGAWAILRQAEPTLTVTQVLTRLQNTGEPITYQSGGQSVTTPRIDLLAALQAGSAPPELTVAEATVTVDEGAVAQNSGTVVDPDGDPFTLSASVGTVVDNGDGTWSWTFQTTDGPAETQEVTITAVDNRGAEGEVTFDLVVLNVAPTVTIAPDQVTVLDEGGVLEVRATFTDPGVLDAPFTATIVCYDIAEFGSLAVPGTVTVTNATPPLLEGTVTGDCPYGDTSRNAQFTVTVTVTDKDGDSGDDSFGVTVNNVDPTVAIDDSGATDVNGVPTVIAQIGVPLDFSAQVTDPGSDDLHLTWDWDDGSTSLATYLVNPPDPDPFPSPSMQPRDVTDDQTNTWTAACMYDVVLTAVDDDGGVGDDAIAVIIAGTSGQARSAGYWLPQYRGNRSNHFDHATLDCYLEIAGHMSAVFDEVRAGTGSRAQAANVLHVAGNQGEMSQLLDQQLLAAWLNFANGAFGYHDLVDTTGDGVPDTAFSVAVATAEAVRVNPASTRAELEEQKDILESINLMHGS